MNRDSSVELYRCLLMFGIVLLHTIGNSIYEDIWASSGLMFCVNGFLLISGYFGINFSWGKVCKLCALGVWCALLTSAFTGGWGWWRIYCEYWFLHAYILLMMFTPLINDYMNHFRPGEFAKYLEGILPILVLCFVWSWLTSYNCTLGIIPRTAGLGHSSGIMMIGMYIIGRLIRIYEVDSKIPVSIAVVVGVCMFALSCFRLGFYNSPVAVCLSICTFTLVKRIDIHNILSKIIFFIAPSMFAVYLLHVTPIWNSYVIPSSVKWIISLGFNKWIAYFVVSIVIFWSCVLIDLPRRLLWRLFK